MTARDFSIHCNHIHDENIERCTAVILVPSSNRVGTKMNLDTELMFECLIYLNMFYYPVFATCESIMTVAKYNSIIDTPNILRDGAVVFTKLFTELVKIVLFRRFKKIRRRTTTAVVVLMTFITISALSYSFFIQDPVLKLEMILNSLSILLTITEVFFGILDLIPWCHRRQYY